VSDAIAGCFAWGSVDGSQYQLSVLFGEMLKREVKEEINFKILNRFPLIFGVFIFQVEFSEIGDEMLDWV
jgi:hypothetical protein